MVYGLYCLPLAACHVHPVGSLWCSPDMLASDSALAAYRISGLGNSYGIAALALSFDYAKELA